MASQTRSAGLGQSIPFAGSDWQWYNPTNIYTSNNVYAYVPLDDGECSEYLRATTFGFTIPGGAIIDGIKVEIEKKSDAPAEMSDYHVYIVKTGSEQGTDKKLAGKWPLTDTYYTYGGAADKWGLTWTVAQINASNFGVSISVRFSEFEEDSTAYIDHIRITVYYTVPGINMKMNTADVWKDGAEVKINIGDVWKPGVKAWQNIGDVWKVIFG